MKLTNCSGSTNPEFFNLTAGVRRNQLTGENMCDLDFDLYKSVMPVIIKITTNMLPRNVNLMRWTLDFCQHLQRDRNSLLLKVYRKIIKLGKMPTECPFTPGSYFMHGLDFNDAMHTTYMPLMDLEIKINFFTTIKKQQVALGELIWIVKLVPNTSKTGTKG